MKVLLDTNIILDVALQRHPYFAESDEVLSLSESNKIEAYISASSISDFYYIARKSIGHEASISFLQLVLTFCAVAAVDQSTIDAALAAVTGLEFRDFEDAIQNCTAESNQLEAVVTRDKKDFAQSTLKIFTPGQLIQILRL